MNEFEQRVNAILGQSTTDDKGNLVLPDVEMDEATKYAVTAEKRRRDTQAEYSRSQQRLRQVEAENTKLTEAWAKDATSKLTKEQQAELEELKATDPDEWREKLNEYEREAQTQFSSKREEISKAAQTETELERRNRLLAEFNEANPEIELNDDVIENDIPPRFIKQLEKGDVTFDQFLDNCKNYLSKGKTFAEGEEPKPTSLSKASGGSRPSESAVEGDIKESYSKTVF